MSIDLMKNDLPKDGDIAYMADRQLEQSGTVREREKMSAAALKKVHDDIDAQEAKDKADRDMLRETIQDEWDEERLARPILDNADYPDERDEKTGQFVRHHALVEDDKERAEATARRSKVSTKAKALKAERKAKWGG